MESAKERLEIILKETGKKINALAKSIGLTQSQGLYDIRSEKIKSISGEIAVCIYKTYPRFDLFWILTGEDDISKTQTNNSDPPQELSEIINRLEKRLENADDAYSRLREDYEDLKIKYNELKNVNPPKRTGTRG